MSFWKTNTNGQFNSKDNSTGIHKFYSPSDPNSQATINERNDPVRVNPYEGSTTGFWRSSQAKKNNP